MEMTLIVAALLASAGSLAVLAAFGLRSAGAHRQDLLAAGRVVADRLHLQWPARLMTRLRPTWLSCTGPPTSLAAGPSGPCGWPSW